MRKWSLTFVGVLVALACVYFLALASVEEPAELVPPSPANPAAASPSARTPVERVMPAVPERIAVDAQPLTAQARASALHGRVLTPDGRPYGRAEVRFAGVRRGRAELERTRTLPDGRFELFPRDPAARGDLLVTAAEHEYAPVARLDLAAGGGELELRLAPPRTFTLRLRDQDGLELVPAEVSFHWILAGVTREDEDESLGESHWARPPVPFRIHVHDPHVADTWLGPFAPAQLGDVLDLVVRRRPFLRGLVVAAGEPVADAEVRMERVSSDLDGKPGRVFPNPRRTGATGEFWFRVDEPGSFHAIAFHEQRGLGRSAEIRLTDGRDLDGLVLELREPPGAIAGRVVLPAGLTAAELALQIGQRTRTLRADGTFVLPGLEPGSHTLWPRGGDPSAPRDAWVRSSDRRPDGLVHDVALSLEVRPGLTTEAILDLVAPPPVRLAGRIELGLPVSDATAFGNFESQGIWFWSEGGRGRWSPALLRPEGTFAVGFSRPGSRRMRVDLLEPLLGSWSVTDELVLGLGENRWDLVLVPGKLRLVLDEELDFLQQPSLHWSGAGALAIEVGTPISGLASASPGALLYEVVPPGRVRFSLTTNGTLFEALVRSGETTEFRFPESAREELRKALDVRTEGLIEPSYLTVEIY